MNTFDGTSFMGQSSTRASQETGKIHGVVGRGEVKSGQFIVQNKIRIATHFSIFYIFFIHALSMLHEKCHVL